MGTDNFSSRRLDNIKRNKALLEDLGVTSDAQAILNTTTRSNGRTNVTKRGRVEKRRTDTLPTRTSARIAAVAARPDYNEESNDMSAPSGSRLTRKAKVTNQRHSRTAVKEEPKKEEPGNAPDANLDELRVSWASWTVSAPPPTRDSSGVFHFESNPDFTPNKSPAEVLCEGAFGGSYFRSLYSKKLGITISDDYLELPPSWIEGLNREQYLTSPAYDPEANKFKVACGQSIEQWEASGWINHKWDVRGWFQWYCRFFAGRRCEDDERQVSRWKKCVGPTGRWRRMLLKKYVSSGVRTVWDDGEDEDTPEVSPVIHQTCHHWAFEVTQDILDKYWRTGK